MSEYFITFYWNLIFDKLTPTYSTVIARRTWDEQMLLFHLFL